MAKKSPKKTVRDVYRLRTANRDHLPLPTGVYKKIGCRDFMVGLNRKGGILLRLYYPAKMDQKEVESGECWNPLRWPNWFPHENYKNGYADYAGVKSHLMFRFISWLNSKRNVFIPAVPNAKPDYVAASGSGNKFPVIVFSHGLGGCRTTYASICIQLASHGFVVAAVEHRDNSACLSFYPKRVRYNFRESNPDFFVQDEIDADDEIDFGDEIDDPNYVPPRALAALTTLPHLEMNWIRHRYVAYNNHKPEVANFRNKQIQHRVRECTRALDLLEALNAGYELNNLLDLGFNKSEFENLLDLDKAIIMGHSMGGSTALMSASAELRFKVCIALDAWMFPIKNEAMELIPQPVLLINTETMDGDQPNREKMREVMSTIKGDDPERRQAFTINSSLHHQQCDIPYVFSSKVLFLSGKYEWKSVKDIDVHDLTMAMSLKFINKFLNLEQNVRSNEWLESRSKKYRKTYED